MRKVGTIPVIVCALGVLGILAWFGWHSYKKDATVVTQYQTSEEASNVYVRFDMEAYDTILSNFWKQATDVDMASLFQLSLEKAVGTTSEPLATSTRAGTAAMLGVAFDKAGSVAAEKALALQTLQVVLYNLPPVGRDELLTSVQQTQLKDTVDNINPNNNLYQDLGVPSGASTQQVDQAYTQKEATLTGTTSPQGQAELKQVTYAHEVLASATAKAQYDENQVEPTVFAHTMGSHTLYLYISKIAPTTINEFAQAIENASTTPALTSLILDLRGNIGGDLDFTQDIMSLFLGPNQYAFDLYHQGNYNAQRTPNVGPLPALSQYKEIAVLTDDMTQSTAELTASSLRRYRLAYLVGTKTRGWGSVEQNFPIKTVIDPNDQYALLLVVDLTLGDDQQPIGARIDR